MEQLKGHAAIHEHGVLTDEEFAIEGPSSLARDFKVTFSARPRVG